MAAAQFDDGLLKEVENYIKAHKVMIFSKSVCPHCKKVKDLFKELGVDYYAVELDLLGNGEQMQDAMARKAGRRSVPQVFVEENHIGGCDDTMAAHKNKKLQKLLKL